MLLRRNFRYPDVAGGRLADGIADPLSGGPSAFSSVGVTRGEYRRPVRGRQIGWQGTTGRRRRASSLRNRTRIVNPEPRVIQLLATAHLLRAKSLCVTAICDKAGPRAVQDGPR